MARAFGRVDFQITVSPGTVANLRAAMRNTSSRRQLLNEWAVIYFRSQLARFNTMSAGRWPAVTERAKRTRMNAAMRSSDLILQDTGTLKSVLRPTKVRPRGQVRRLNAQQLRVTVGIGHDLTHPRKSNNKQRRTVGDVAAIHHFGQGRNPVREVISMPNPRALQKMETKAYQFLRRALGGKRSR